MWLVRFSLATFFACVLLLHAPFAHAQSTYTLPDVSVTAPAPGFNPLVTPQGTALANIYSQSNPADLSSFVSGLFTFAITIGAFAAVFRLAYAGYLYMGQADMWSKKGEARTIIGDVVLGLLLLLAVWLILNQINPDILSLKGLQVIQQHPVQQQGTLNQANPNSTAGLQGLPGSPSGPAQTP